jgi:transcriptional regulator with XRE-family HTH domain
MIIDMPDSRQFKAARALLDWTQDDLAKASGVALPTIANIERGSSRPRQDTLQTLQKTFESQGIEFLEPSGVQLVSERFALRVWNGREAQFKLWNDIYKEFSDGTGGEILLNNVSDLPLVERYPDEALVYVRRLDALKVKRRILLCEGDDHIIGSYPDWYRQVPPALFGQTAYYVYADKVALLIWSIPRILLIQNQNVADTFRTQFDHNWSLARPVEKPIQIL